MLRFSSLGSGSKGNATLIECGKTRVLVDCGFSTAETERRLHRLDCPPDSLSAILVTHEHGDHANGVGRLSRKHKVPVWLTVGTYNVVKDNKFSDTNFININNPFELADLQISPYPVPHDAREPCQFVFSDGDKRLGLLTDTGSITPYIVSLLQKLDGLLLECNYDARMLAVGPYPPKLKTRVGSNYGHLDNQQATDLLKRIELGGLQHLVGMHLSEKNNLPEHAQYALGDGLGCTPDEVTLATQDGGFDWRELR
uniref:Metal-dependent hydrolases of the beta-lactamase superfamily I n=1 Tax=uncultured Thiotrichaceae bacterium TaxID=298394 RepID=A0A6S6S8A8_9GAMM|nr:MAG: Metal-dependent hydrolases of the beta-lactamase superfamily I [uncultured Thiotrichaceae bacterium]